MQPLSKDSAIKRIHAAGLTLADTVNMRDAELLRLPTIGRRTLRYIRTLEVI
jgi:hypothetical protein